MKTIVLYNKEREYNRITVAVRNGAILVNNKGFIDILKGSVFNCSSVSPDTLRNIFDIPKELR